jgi:SAM-dependent methyltransferase
MAGLQFSLLFALGLREKHRLLDIGCGSLRAGRLFIPYLAPGNYYGIEPNEELVEAGIADELGRDACALKQPHFLFRDDFAFREFNARFDFLVAQSILSHTHEDLARLLLGNAREVIADRGVFCGTFFLQRPVTGRHGHRLRGTAGQGWVGMGGVAYRWAELERMASDAGFAVRRLSFPHPRQSWFVAVPTHQRDRLRALARQASSWQPMARELEAAEPLKHRNRRLYVAKRRLRVLSDRLLTRDKAGPAQ